ncbi:MAG: GNAT family N-acetyltransferase [Euryarchaeota archaeon]|nr:GNAT family N-acetyltransferase [Euryarchaeota archaeon]MDE1835789.1 GNAT family N-acetyltransferase [Euryarchaeota archaeon]MDE1880737.1 GNAT family N-acetyltransferase [Euryarchaeota archaeon]MDE2043980.1 GNAT family N-acetyltransferase [Thermoplasmata archaeon]
MSSRRRTRPPRRPARAAPFRVRTATPRDLETLVQHRRKMWGDIWKRGAPSSSEMARADREYRRWVMNRTRAHRFVGFIAEGPEGTVLGSGGLWLREERQPRPRDDGRPIPYLLSMYTERKARGQHVASKIVAEALAWSKRHGYRIIILHASNMGRGVYERAGFRSGREMLRRLPAPRGVGSKTRRR